MYLAHSFKSLLVCGSLALASVEAHEGIACGRQETERQDGPGIFVLAILLFLSLGSLYLLNILPFPRNTAGWGPCLQHLGF